MMLQESDFRLEHAAGMSLDVPSGQWSLSDDLAVNYIACFKAAARQPSPPPLMHAHDV